jgi:hypothetical protein
VPGTRVAPGVRSGAMSGLARTRDRILPPAIIVSAVVGLAVGLMWFLGWAETSVPVGPTVPPAAQPSIAQRAGPSPSAGQDPDAVATRVVIRSLGIDLPVVSGAVGSPGQGPDGYPPCDVAMYLPDYVQPGQRGTTYLYAHARDGMFLPLLRGSERNDGADLLGTLVEVYTSDGRQHVYTISRVKRHALDFSLAQDIPRRSRRLVLQTSEGPRGTVPKLQVLAEPVTTLQARPEDAHPSAVPRACYDE